MQTSRAERAGLHVFSSTWITCATVLAVAGPASFALSLDAEVDFHIASGLPLETALLEFSRQAGVPLYVAATLLEHHKAAGVSGRLTVRAALTKLLEDSGLSYRAVGNAITIVPASRPSARDTPPTSMAVDS